MSDRPESNEAPTEQTAEASNALSGSASEQDAAKVFSAGPNDNFPNTPLAFLQAIAPDGPWCLAAIDKDKKLITVATFGPRTEGKCEEWVARFNGERNVYFTVNPVTHALTKKAERTDIAALAWLHVDVDPRVGEPFASERERLLALMTTNLPKGVPPPNVIIDSGGGYQAFWKLVDLLQIDGDLDKAEDAKRYNQALEMLFRADPCHNVDRLMRLPFTLNIPDKKKRDKGRAPAMATLVRCDLSRAHRFGDMPAPVPVADTTPNAPAASAGTVADLGALPLRLQRIAREGCIADEPKEGDNTRSQWVFDFMCGALRAGATDHALLGWLMDETLPIGESIRERKSGAEKFALRRIAEARAEVAKDPVRLSKDEPLRSARAFVAKRRPTLLHYNDDWLAHDGAAYAELENATVKSELYEFLDKAVTVKKDGDDFLELPFCPSARKVSDVIDALKARAHAQRDIYAPPCWLPGGSGPPPRELLACRNGLLHLPTGELLPPSDRFFTRNALAFDFDARAPEPERWREFLGELWPDGDEIALLQEIFGYLLTPDTSQQKIFTLVGPKRSGKGTIGRVLGNLVGHANRCSPTLDSLGDTFGLEPLIGKQLALISDMRIGSKTDRAKIAENLLRISGEDDVTAGRKYKTAWTGRLGARFFVMTNEMPSVPDASGALASRFVPLMMTASFFGREDPGLIDKLLPELPGILNWSIAGWRRLRERGHFVLPKSSREAVIDMENLGSPVKAFLREILEDADRDVPRFVMDRNEDVPKKVLFELWKEWCLSREQRAYDIDWFAKKLIEASERRIGSARLRRGTPGRDGIKPLTQCFTGIKDNAPF